MDRFFSKLDLRDIKIDPFRTSFPPDGEDDSPAEELALDAAPAAVAEPARQPYVPAWSAVAPVDLEAVDLEAVAVAARAESVSGAVAAVEAVAVAPVVLPDVEPRAAGYAAVEGLDASGEVLKVSARSRPSAVAGAIAGVVREHGRAEVQAIGAGATNQAVKAVAIARDYLRETGIEAVCLPAFIDVTIENEDRTAIRLVVEPR